MRTVLLLLLGACAAGFVQAADDSNFYRKIAADPHGTVEISNVAGSVVVAGWDNPEVEVHGDLGPGVERVDVLSEHGRTIVKVIVPNHSFKNVDTDLHIRVPRDSELDISGVSAEVAATDVTGGLMLKTVSGDVKSDLFQKNAEIKTVSGDVSLRGHGQSTSIRVSTISGNVRVDRGAGDLEATTVSGDLTLRLDPARMVRIRTTSGDASFEGKFTKGAQFDAQTVSGEVTVRGAPEAGMDYELSTFSGDITDCMGEQAEKVSKYGPGRRLSGSKGTAGAQGAAAHVRVKTMSGDVELCDKG